VGCFLQAADQGAGAFRWREGWSAHYDPVMMFKIMVLQALYSLSDDQAEFQIEGRLVNIDAGSGTHELVAHRAADKRRHMIGDRNITDLQRPGARKIVDEGRTGGDDRGAFHSTLKLLHRSELAVAVRKLH
jgi:hypothetical protein